MVVGQAGVDGLPVNLRGLHRLAHWSQLNQGLSGVAAVAGPRALIHIMNYPVGEAAVMEKWLLGHVL